VGGLSPALNLSISTSETHPLGKMSNPVRCALCCCAACAVLLTRRPPAPSACPCQHPRPPRPPHPRRCCGCLRLAVLQRCWPLYAA
jgi:hypothetical protein